MLFMKRVSTFTDPRTPEIALIQKQPVLTIEGEDRERGGKERKKERKLCYGVLEFRCCQGVKSNFIK